MALQLRSRSQHPAAHQRFFQLQRCERRLRGSWKMEHNGRQEENRGNMESWRTWQKSHEKSLAMSLEFLGYLGSIDLWYRIIRKKWLIGTLFTLPVVDVATSLVGVAVRTTQPLLVARPSTNLSTWQVPDTFADRLVQCQWWHEVQRPRWSPALPLLMLALLAAVEEHLALGWSKDIPRNSHGRALIHLKGCEESSPQELLGVSYPLELERPTWRIWEVSQSVSHVFSQRPGLNFWYREGYKMIKMHLEEQFMITTTITTECSTFLCQPILRWIWELPWTAKFRIHLASCHNKWLGIFQPEEVSRVQPSKTFGTFVSLVFLKTCSGCLVTKPVQSWSLKPWNLRDELIDSDWCSAEAFDCRLHGKSIRQIFEAYALYIVRSWAEKGDPDENQQASSWGLQKSMMRQWVSTRRMVLDAPTSMI